MKTAICPGSFDPVTIGHVDIIERASAIFDRVVVAVMYNSQKKHCFSPEKRMELLRKSLAHLANVEVDSSTLLLADYAAGLGETVIVKGLRALSDFEYEFQMALINKRLNPSLDTMFLTAGESFQYLSSSMVREIGALGGDISGFVPRAVLEDVSNNLK